MKKVCNYYLTFLVAALCALFLTAGCEKQEEGAESTPGTNAPLKTPQDLSTKVMGTTVKFAWRAQPEAASFVFQLSGDAAFSNPQTIALSASTHLIEALAVTTSYWVRVQAVGAVETFSSPYTEALTFRTGNENILKATPAELRDVGMTLQWTPGALVTHLVALDEGRSATFEFPINDDEKAAGEKALTGLQPETEYYVRLYNGDNLRGEGEYTTLPLVMDDLAITLVNAAPDSLNLSWADGELVTHFVVSPEPAEGGATITVAGHEATLRGLLPATEYTVAVFYNRSARGAPTFTTAPLAPVALTLTDVRPQGASVSWTPSDGYVTQLEARPASGAAATVAVTAADAAGKAIDNLQPDTDYTISLLYIYGGNTYTRASVACKTGVPPQARTRYMKADGSDADALRDTIAGCISGDAVALAAGITYEYTGTYEPATGVSFTIQGADDGTSILKYRQWSLPPAVDSIVFRNLKLQPNGGDYFINQGTGDADAANVGRLVFDGCDVSGFNRSLVRMQGGGTQTIGTLAFHNCIVHDMLNNTYPIVQYSNANAKIEHIVITNSTFANLHLNGTNASVFETTGGAVQSFTINNCTFYGVAGGGTSTNRYFVTLGSNATPVTVSNTILSLTRSAVGGIRTGGTVTVTNVYTTSDWNTSGYIVPNVTAYAGTSDDLFVDPANGDFHFKDASFAGAATSGDPRWRNGGGPGPGSSWTKVDLGPNGAGSHTFGGGQLSITGKGKWESANQSLTFVYLPVTGAFTATVKVVSYEADGSAGNGGQAGLLVTPDITATENNFVHWLAGTQKELAATAYSRREAVGTNAGRGSLAAGGAGAEVYLKIERNGDSVKLYASKDGADWGSGSSRSFSGLADALYIGPAMNSNHNSTATTAVFAQFTLNGQSVVFE
jgi:hypothetical protein